MTTIKNKGTSMARRVRTGYMTAFILLFIAYLLNYYTTKKLLDQSNSVAYTNKVLNNLHQLNANVKDAEANLNAFLLVKDNTFLQPYNASLHKNDSIQNNLRQLFAKDTYMNHDLPNRTIQKQRLDTITKLINTKYEVMGDVIAMMQQQHNIYTDTIRKKIYECKTIMNALQQNINLMQRYQVTIADDGEYDYNKTYVKISLINFASLTLAALFAFYAVIVFNRENKAKKTADEKSEQYRAKLEANVIKLQLVNEELEKLKSLEKFAAAERMARTFAHEIRNPLTNISLATEQLSVDDAENTETQMLLQMISRNVNRINQLITDLLNSTKFAQLDYKKVSINKLLDEMLEFAKDRINLSHVTVIKHYEDGICDVSVDNEKMKIALLNIVVNAIEAFNNKEGVITITTENKENKCVVIIKDNGPGISEENISRIFDPYFTNKPRGTGLGLTHTQNIILNHKGEIIVSSKLNEGCTFTIKLEFDQNHD